MKLNQPAATLVVVVLVVLSVAVVPAAAAAQEGDSTTATTTSTTTENSSTTDPANAPTLAGDDQLHVVDHYVEDGTMYVELYADQVRRVSVSAPPSDSGAQAGGYVTTALVREGETQTVAVRSPTGTVWLSTKQSVDNGRFTVLRTDTGGLISGPWTANDSLLATIGGALGVSAFVLYRAVEAYFGRDQRGERIA